ncbi:hypothetical protein EOA19_25490 [Mesorhizobium sp. M7A.F.Ca.US.010.02.1.1]|nr:hypothetical protein EOA19_25490 [Mesorhizobium sp. M7A.F.Ca.US.010.02.1.1]
MSDKKDSQWAQSGCLPEGDEPQCSRGHVSVSVSSRARSSWPGALVSPTARHPSDCGAAALQNKIGLSVTGNSAEDVRVGVAPVRSKGDVRVFAPGQAVIHNYSDARLNLETE